MPGQRPPCSSESNPTVDLLYQEDFWKDVTPIPQADVERPMAQIFYPIRYRKAMDLFRGLLKRNELSQRTLDLTLIILKINPGHYTVWSYRYKTIEHLHRLDPEAKQPQRELELLNGMMAKIQKAYQCWQHRVLLVALIGNPAGEIEFLNQLLETDWKNYHSWVYRQGLLTTYGGEMWEGELPFVEGLIQRDVRNNSAWNHRFFIVFETFLLQNPNASDSDFASIVERELDYTRQQILVAPNNPSAWNYLRGVLKRASLPYERLRDFVTPLTKTAGELDANSTWPEGLNEHSNLPVAAAVEFLADTLSSTDSSKAVDLYALLGDKLDPIRKGYWNYRSQIARSITSS